MFFWFHISLHVVFQSKMGFLPVSLGRCARQPASPRSCRIGFLSSRIEGGRKISRISRISRTWETDRWQRRPWRLQSSFPKRPCSVQFFGNKAISYCILCTRLVGWASFSRAVWIQGKGSKEVTRLEEVLTVPCRPGCLNMFQHVVTAPKLVTLG